MDNNMENKAENKMENKTENKIENRTENRTENKAVNETVSESVNEVNNNIGGNTNNPTPQNIPNNFTNNYNVTNGQPGYGYQNPYLVLRPTAPPPEHEDLKKFKSNFPYFLWATVIYSVVYAICRYKNDRGITTPILVVLTFIFFDLLFKKLGKTFEKKTYPYAAAIIALGISNFCSDDYFIVGMNFIAALLLFVTFIIRNIYDCSNWNLSKHLSAMMESIFGALPHMFCQFGDSKKYKEQKGTAKKESDSTKGAIVIGVLISIGLLIIILPLLVSADQFFGESVANLFNSIFNLFDDESNHTVIFFSIYTIAVFIAMYGFIRKMCAHDISQNVVKNEKMPATIAITVNSILGFIYIIFSGFQIYYLFLGRMTLPESATYAEYAHEGFFQLVVVCLINMIMVLIFIHCFKNTLALKISLTVISASTYIMIASSALRMIMYVQAYDLSYLRLFVFWALIVIFMAMNGIVIYTFKENFPMFRYLLVTTTILYIAFAYSNPTYIITKNNLERRYSVSDEYNAKVDLSYLQIIYNDGAAKAICDSAIEHNDVGLYDYFHDELKDSLDMSDNNLLKLNLSKLSGHNAANKCIQFFGY